MDLLNLLNKVKVQTLSFEKHPIAKLDDEMKIHYLNGLALIMVADGNILDKEKEYLSILINSFGLSDEILDSFIEFAQSPDEKSVLEMMKAFMSKEIKYNFMIDAMMMANSDEEFHENEKAVIEQYFEMFKITADEKKDLKDIYDMFKKQDGNRLFRYFGKQDKYDTYIIKKELFEYLLDYYNIDMSYELQENEKRVLDFEFFKPTFSDGGLVDGATEIMVKPVNNEQFCIFLNSVFLSKEIEFNGDGKIVNSETKDILMNLEMSDIKFENNEFIVKNSEDEEKKVTGMNVKMIDKFAKWASKYNNLLYKITHFHVQEHATSSQEWVDLSSFIYKPYNEYYYTTANKDNKEGYRIIPINQSKFKASSPSKCSNNYLNNTTSFRLMKLSEGK